MKVKMYGYFDIREELDEFRSQVIKKHPNLSEEIKALQNYSGWDKKSKILALKEIVLKTRIDPDEANSKYLIGMLDEMFTNCVNLEVEDNNGKS